MDAVNVKNRNRRKSSNQLFTFLMSLCAVTI
jgi:hypothetical protein